MFTPPSSSFLKQQWESQLELVYLPDEKWTPRCVLELYNITWLHHELCSKLFQSFHGDLSRNKFFGSYLHSLVVHAPLQREIISLRSVNTENQERYFNQARRAATNASNRQPQNVISTILLRLQAKAEYRDIFGSVQHGESMVAKAASNVSQYSGTYITRKFLQHRTRSWQAHLERVSTYLTPGEGVWWKKTSTGYHFFDGDDDPEQHNEGPSLQHFRYTSIPEVISQHKEAWEVVLQKEIELPTPRLHKYGSDGNPVTSHNSNNSIPLPGYITTSDSSEALTCRHYWPRPFLLSLSLADNSQAPVPALPDNSQAPVPALPDNSQAPVPALPDNSQAPVPALPDNSQAPVPALPDNSQAPVAALPDNSQAPVAALPDNSQAPVPALPDNSQAPVPALPDNSQAPVPALPDNSQAPVPTLPDKRTAPVPALPDNSQAPVPTLPDKRTAPVPALPDNSQAPVPALPDNSQAPVPALPDNSQAPVPALPDNSQAPVPTLPDKSTAPVPALPDNSQEPTCSYEHPVPHLPSLLDDSQTHKDPCHNSIEGNPSETITEFIDYIPNPTTELQPPMDTHTYKTKHATEISRVIGNTDELMNIVTELS